VTSKIVKRTGKAPTKIRDGVYDVEYRHVKAGHTFNMRTPESMIRKKDRY
jgi:hypothetical protein